MADKIADKIALNLNIAKDSIKRIKSGLIYAISNELSNGHLYVELEDLKSKTCQLLEINLEENSSNVNSIV